MSVYIDQDGRRVTLCAECGHDRAVDGVWCEACQPVRGLKPYTYRDFIHAIPAIPGLLPDEETEA